MMGVFNKRLFSPILMISVAIIMLGCSSPTSKIIGNWSDLESEDSIEFFKDNTFSLKSGVMNFSGKWVDLDDGRIKIELSIMGISQTWMGNLESKKLILELPGGKKATYQKIKS